MLNLIISDVYEHIHMQQLTQNLTLL